MKSKISWYINRFSLMSPMEIGHRIKWEIKKKSERLLVKDFSPDVSIIDKEIHWYFGVQDKDQIISFVRKEGIWNEDEAIELMDHKFTFFSFDRKYLGKTINWHQDYKNDKESPLKYCKDIDYRNFDEVGDIKYTWEINRHLHLIPLAKAYYLTLDQKYKEEVVEQIKSWIETNPYMKGVNWESSLELGIRLISWSWVWCFIGCLDEEFKRMWLECIYKHCNIISKNFSGYSSANNHLIGEAAGLFIASIAWPFERKSKEWQDKSYRILLEEIEKQNYEDGVNKEQSTSYQQFVLDFFILAGVLGGKNGVVFPESYWERIEQMIMFIASIMDKNGNVPAIGDADDGYAVILSEDEGFNPYQSLITTGAVLFNRGDFKSKAEKFDEKSLWLMGIEGFEQFTALEEKMFKPIKTFEKGGYYILSAFENTENEVRSVFDCGPLGFLSIAAHGHSDALSFTLSIGGQEFIIDPGTYAYHTKEEWREYFKGTSAHNTIRIDGESQSISGGDFMWLRKAKSRLIQYESNDDFDLVIGEHDGYKRLKDPVTHQRELKLDKKHNTIRIVDRISAKDKHMVEQYFHFSRDCVLEKTTEHDWCIKIKDKEISLKVDERLHSNVFRGSLQPISGWQSKRFDVKEETFTIVNSNEFRGNCEFETIIIIK
ncbi:MAG: alginate lyase family protein [Candidatus Scalindua sp.]